MDLMQRGGSSSSTPAVAHPSDVHALAEGAEETPRRGIWRIVLSSILHNHKWKKGVPKRDLLTLLQYVEEDMGGEVEESTQEGENTACGLVKEAVLRQILQHTLTVYLTEGGQGVITLAEEELDTLQALLETGAEREDRPPLPHHLPPPNSTLVEEETLGNATRGGHSTAPCPPWHVTQFSRRHGTGEGHESPPACCTPPSA